MKYLCLVLLFLSSFAVLAEEVNIPKDHRCYNICKSRKSFLTVVGETVQGTEIKGCGECLKVQGTQNFKLPHITIGGLCYEECKTIKPHGGPKVEGLDRPSCGICIKSHPQVFKISESKIVRCDVSNDELTVTCENGYEYKRNDSVMNNIERSVIKDGKKAHPEVRPKPSALQQ